MIRYLLTLFLIIVPAVASAQGVSRMNAHQFSFTHADGTPADLSAYAGKAVLVVNTASACGLTPQYAELQGLHEDYADKGLVVLAVPSNDFGGQEPGSTAEIQEFTTEKFEVTFPVVQKEVVKGADAHPFYQWAGEQTSMLGRPKWNFHKYLISPEGEFVDWFASTTSPSSGKVINAIEGALPTN